MKKKIKNMYFFEKMFNDLGYELIAGIDEAGRGAWAGPIVVAACILPLNYENDEIDDSKKLSSSKREQLFDQICKDAVSYWITVIDATTVDQLNPKRATVIAMEQCIKQIDIKPEIILVDSETINTAVTSYSIIKGDEKSISIAAASILAKVSRDNLMQNYHKKYPSYGFDSHKGYGTEKHLLAIEKHGCIKGVHRYSYKPIKSLKKS